jgi:hypothetical protein
MFVSSVTCFSSSRSIPSPPPAAIRPKKETKTVIARSESPSDVAIWSCNSHPDGTALHQEKSRTSTSTTKSCLSCNITYSRRVVEEYPRLPAGLP